MPEQEDKKQLSFEDTTFFGLLKNDPLEPLAFPFVISAIIIICLIVYHLKTGSSEFLDNILSESVSIFSISISSLGLILAALALVIVIFSKRTMHRATLEGVFQQFILPFYISAISWTVLSLLTLFQILFKDSPFLEENQSWENTLGFTVVFFLCYSILFTMRIIASIISNTLLAAYEDYEENGE